MLMILRYLLGYGNAATSDSNTSPSPRAASLLSTVLGAVMLWSVAAERPAFLYVKATPQHSAVSKVLVENYQRCGYHDCSRLVALPSYFDRDLMAWYMRQQQALEAKAAVTDCQHETEWLASLAEPGMVDDERLPVLAPPCLPVQEQQYNSGYYR